MFTLLEMFFYVLAILVGYLTATTAIHRDAEEPRGMNFVYIFLGVVLFLFGLGGFIALVARTLHIATA